MQETQSGCLTDVFCQKAKNNFSNILSSSETAKEFSEHLRELVYHVQDVHEWEDSQCKFHALKVCSYGDCENKNEPKCEGRDYHTREILSCPFHLLVYEIECHLRANMANKLVDPALKRGHSNWLESSHNVFIRFRPKRLVFLGKDSTITWPPTCKPTRHRSTASKALPSIGSWTSFTSLSSNWLESSHNVFIRFRPKRLVFLGKDSTITWPPTSVCCKPTRHRSTASKALPSIGSWTSFTSLSSLCTMV